MGLKSSFKLKNELYYNPATYNEWTIAGAGTTKSVTGIHLVADGANDYVKIPVVCKSNQKYGLLYYVVATDLNDNLYISASSIVGTVTLVTKAVGNNKAIFTTANPITAASLCFVTGSVNVDGKYIDLKELRLFELPTGSEIEADFTNLTADQLNIKYPLFFGSIGAGKMGGIGGLK